MENIRILVPDSNDCEKLCVVHVTEDTLHPTIPSPGILLPWSVCVGGGVLGLASNRKNMRKVRTCLCCDYVVLFKTLSC